MRRIQRSDLMLTGGPRGALVGGRRRRDPARNGGQYSWIRSL